MYMCCLSAPANLRLTSIFQSSRAWWLSAYLCLQKKTALRKDSVRLRRHTWVTASCGFVKRCFEWITHFLCSVKRIIYFCFEGQWLWLTIWAYSFMLHHTHNCLCVGGGGGGFKDERSFLKRCNSEKKSMQKNCVSSCVFSITCSSNSDTLKACDFSKFASACAEKMLDCGAP